MKNVAILGSTGSIGRSSLKVIEKLGHRFKVVGLAAGRNTKLLETQVEEFRPKIVSLGDREEALEFRQRLKKKSIRVAYGPEGAEEVACFDENDIVVSAIPGIDGLRPTLAAVKAGNKIALANKESMVVAGALILAKAREIGSKIIPVDSEHSGIFQCLAKEKRNRVRKVTLTASGGPFFRRSRQEMERISLREALNHPTWKMGKKVTIDSATLMNKGLELIEARWLFNLKSQQLAVLIHPQSIVHSLVEMCDGSVLAQLSTTDMRVPIQYALTYPDRDISPVPYLDLTQIMALEFFKVDLERFPLIKLSRQALEEEGSFPVALNAANEIAVCAFLEEKIRFMDISKIVTEIVESHQKKDVRSLEDILEVDKEEREKARNLLRERV